MIHNSPRKICPGSYTTDKILRVCDRPCKNDNNSDWGKEAIHLHALLEYPFKLSSINQRSSTNHRSDSVLIQSCSIWPNVLHTENLKNAKYSPWLDLVAILTGKLTYHRKQQVDKKHFLCFCTHQISTFWSYNFFWSKFRRLGGHRSSDRNGP